MHCLDTPLRMFWCYGFVHSELAGDCHMHRSVGVALLGFKARDSLSREGGSKVLFCSSD